MHYSRRRLVLLAAISLHFSITNDASPFLAILVSASRFGKSSRNDAAHAYRRFCASHAMPSPIIMANSAGSIDEKERAIESRSLRQAYRLDSPPLVYDF